MITSDSDGHTNFKSWAIICLLVLFVMFKGALAFLVIGDLGQPDWDYRPMKDIPAESPYAAYELLPHPQHVRGEKGE
uniref:Uncharacterized protein n=1 Tax=Candidatus Kentrum eta TaxID=2126337 RepID=A0A450VTC1_9GAMM|nr:MAG: hypothetical protein BECKH772C_GA0070978_104722 [Candidatus Kentron sp. H]